MDTPEVSTDYYGHKFDEGKLQISLVPPALLQATARALVYGLKKYGERGGWLNVPNRRQRYFDALLRHLLAVWEHGFDAFDDGPDGSGLLHWDLFCANVSFISYDLVHPQEEGTAPVLDRSTPEFHLQARRQR